jgi:hypothetical protein
MTFRSLVLKLPGKGNLILKEYRNGDFWGNIIQWQCFRSIGAQYFFEVKIKNSDKAMMVDFQKMIDVSTPQIP